jgi:hypothetical protein
MLQKTSGSPEWDAALLARINLDFIEYKELGVRLQHLEEILKQQWRRSPLVGFHVSSPVLQVLDSRTISEEMMPCFQGTHDPRLCVFSAVTPVVVIPHTEPLTIRPNRSMIKNSPRRMSTKPHI